MARVCWRLREGGLGGGGGEEKKEKLGDRVCWRLREGGLGEGERRGEGKARG
jgi:hypothetical protein